VLERRDAALRTGLDWINEWALANAPAECNRNLVHRAFPTTASRRLR
jgi:hypothetical protein